jgi:hypothetical protein
VTTLHIVPYIENEQVIYMELKTELASNDYVLLVTESEASGTVTITAGNNSIQEEFLSGHSFHALGRTADNQMIFNADYYLNNIIPECATYLSCQQIKLSERA